MVFHANYDINVLIENWILFFHIFRRWKDVIEDPHFSQKSLKIELTNTDNEELLPKNKTSSGYAQEIATNVWEGLIKARYFNSIIVHYPLLQKDKY